MLDKLLDYKKLRESNKTLQADCLFDEIVYLAFLNEPNYVCENGDLRYHLEEYAQDAVDIRRNIWWAKRPHISSFINAYDEIKFKPKKILLNGDWISFSTSENKYNLWNKFSTKRNINDIREKICQRYIENIINDDIYPSEFLDSIYDDDCEPFPNYWQIDNDVLISNPLRNK